MRLSMPSGSIEGRYGYEKMFTLMKEAGFDAVDYSLCPMVKDDCMWNSDNYAELAREMRRACDNAGFMINQTHAPFQFTPAQWDDEMSFTRMVRSLEIAGIIGADVEVVHPLHHFIYHGNEEEIFEKNMEYYSKLIPYARDFGVKIGVENMFQRDVRRKTLTHDTCSTISEFLRYIDTLNSDQIVACLDVGHVGLPPQDDEAWDFIRALGHDRLKSLHVHDNNYQNDQHVLPFIGIMNWDEITKALGEIDYDGDFTFEVGGSFLGRVDDEFFPTALKYMADVGKHLMKKIDAARPVK